MNDAKKLQRSTFIQLALLFGLFVMLIIRCRYSFCQSDESYYPAMINRLWLGERVFTDAKGVTNFYVIFFVPFHAIYRAIVHSNDGIIFYYRMVYTVLSLLVALLVYRGLKKNYTGWGAFFAAAIIMVHSRANINGVSYYNICFLMTTASCVLAFETRKKDQEKKIVQNIILGITSTLAVMCNPFLGILMLALFVDRIFIAKNLRSCLYIIIGIVIISIPDIIALSRISISDIFTNVSSSVPSMTKPRTDHESIVSRVIQFPVSVIKTAKLCLGTSVIYSVYILFLEKKHREMTRNIIFSVYVIISAGLLVVNFILRTVIFAEMATVAMTVVALPCFIKEIKSKKLSAAGVMYAVGWVAALFWHAASNTTNAQTAGFCVSAIGGILLILDDKDNADEKQGLIYAAVLWALLFAMTAFYRFAGVYRDAALPKLTEKLTDGPAQGLYTTAEHADMYYSVLETIEKQQERLSEPGAQVLYSYWLPWAYLCSDCGYATPTPWHPLPERYEEYYANNPAKTPTVVFMFKPEVGAWDSHYMDIHGDGKTPNENTEEAEFWNAFLKDYELIDEGKAAGVYALKKGE